MCQNCPKSPFLTYFFNGRRPSWIFSKFQNDVHLPRQVLYDVLKFRNDPMSHLWDLTRYGRTDGRTDGRHSYIPLSGTKCPRGIKIITLISFVSKIYGWQYLLNKKQSYISFDILEKFLPYFFNMIISILPKYWYAYNNLKLFFHTKYGNTIFQAILNNFSIPNYEHWRGFIILFINYIYCMT